MLKIKSFNFPYSVNITRNNNRAKEIQLMATTSVQKAFLQNWGNCAFGKLQSLQ